MTLNKGRADVPVVGLVVPTVAIFSALALANVSIHELESILTPASWTIFAGASVAFAGTVAVIEAASLVRAARTLWSAAEARSVANVASVLFGLTGFLVASVVAGALAYVTEWVPK